MTCYRIELKNSAKKSLTSLPKPVVKKLTELIEALADNPLPQGIKNYSVLIIPTESGVVIIVYSVFDDSLIIHL